MARLFILLVFIVGFCVSSITHAQETDIEKKYELELKSFYKTEIGQTYLNFILQGGGLSALVSKQVVQRQKIALLMGAYDMFCLSSGKGFVSGDKGISISNKLGAYIGMNFYFKKRKNNINIGTYIGWENLTRKGTINNSFVNNIDYKNNINQMATDIEFKLSHKLTERISFSGSTIFEISKLVNFDEVLEYPNISYSIGLRFKLNN